MKAPLDPADSHVERARALLVAGRNDDAIHELHAALAAEPDSFEGHCLMSAALLDLGKPADSLRAAGRAVQLDPDDARPHQVMAYAYIRLNKGKQALAAALEAQRCEPQDATVVIAVGSALLSCGRAAEAEAAARRAIALEPQSAGGYDLHGRAVMAMKAYPQAEADFREALRLDPTSWVSQNNLGVVLQRQKKKKEAVESFEGAVRTDPRANLARRNLVGATRAYVGVGSIFLVFIAIRVVQLIVESTRTSINWPLVVVLAGILALGIGLWLRGYLRSRGLSPAVVSFYKLENRRNLWPSVLYFFFVIGPLVAVLIAILFFASTPWVLPSAVLGLVAAGSWARFSGRLWRTYVLPRLRPEDAYE